MVKQLFRTGRKEMICRNHMSLKNVAATKTRVVLKHASLFLLLLLLVVGTACDRRAGQAGRDELSMRKEFNVLNDTQRVELLYTRIQELDRRIAELEAEADEGYGLVPSLGFQLLLFLLAGVLLYLSRKRIVRALSFAKGSGSGNKTETRKTPERDGGRPNREEAGTGGAPPDPSGPHVGGEDKTRPSSTFPAPAAAPEIRPGAAEERAGTDLPLGGTIKSAGDEMNSELESSYATFYAYAPANDLFTLIREDEMDEHVIFKITLDESGKSASFTIVDNDRQQRNVLSNRASFASSINYLGEVPANFHTASVTPGLLRADGDRWRITDRIIIRK